MSHAIQVDSLEKRYGTHTVLNKLSFQVEQGELFALLGTNGAGKTTTLECMEGLRQYDGGSIRLKGRLGIQLQSASLPSHIQPMEAVRLFAKWNHIVPDAAMLATLGIDDLGKKQYISLSTGQKRRLHLALALVNNPDIVFLDEPTAGLDVEGRISLHSQIRQLKARGKTIVLASHDMAEVETLCDRIGILNGGKLAFLGTVPELTAKVGKHFTLQVKTGQGDRTLQTEDMVGTLLPLLEELREKKIPLLDIKIDRGNLEQHFMRIAKGEKE